jgi:hypothetical protein
MVADPLGDVGLRAHHALIERAIPGELKIFFLAIGRIGDGADCQDDFNHSEASIQKRNSKMLRRIDARVSNFGMNFAFCCGAWSPLIWQKLKQPDPVPA